MGQHLLSDTRPGYLSIVSSKKTYIGVSFKLYRAGAMKKSTHIFMVGSGAFMTRMGFTDNISTITVEAR